VRSEFIRSRCVKAFVGSSLVIRTESVTSYSNLVWITLPKVYNRTVWPMGTFDRSSTPAFHLSHWQIACYWKDIILILNKIYYVTDDYSFHVLIVQCDSNTFVSFTELQLFWLILFFQDTDFALYANKIPPRRLTWFLLNITFCISSSQSTFFESPDWHCSNGVHDRVNAIESDILSVQRVVEIVIQTIKECNQTQEQQRIIWKLCRIFLIAPVRRFGSIWMWWN
jgi:hypothetical protein